MPSPQIHTEDGTCCCSSIDNTTLTLEPKSHNDACTKYASSNTWDKEMLHLGLLPWSSWTQTKHSKVVTYLFISCSICVVCLSISFFCIFFFLSLFKKLFKQRTAHFLILKKKISRLKGKQWDFYFFVLWYKRRKFSKRHISFICKKLNPGLKLFSSPLLFDFFGGKLQQCQVLGRTSTCVGNLANWI